MSNKIYGSFKALAAHHEETGVKRTDYYRVPPSKLVEEPGFNERDYDDPEVKAQIEAFAQAYAAGRPVPPLTIRVDASTGEIIVVDGHQRRRGALLAIERGHLIPYLDCLPFKGNDADRVVYMLTSAQGLKLKPVRVARGYLRLMRMGLEMSEIALSVAKTVQHVESMLVLAEANTDVQALVNQGAVSATTAIEMVRKHGEKAGAILCEKLKQAQASGQTKIKPSSIKEWAPSRTMATRLHRSMGDAFGRIAQTDEVKKMITDLETSGEESLAGKSVTVDAVALINMIKVYQDLEDARRKTEKGTPNQASEG